MPGVADTDVQEESSGKTAGNPGGFAPVVAPTPRSRPRGPPQRPAARLTNPTASSPSSTLVPSLPLSHLHLHLHLPISLATASHAPLQLGLLSATRMLRLLRLARIGCNAIFAAQDKAVGK